MIEATEKNKNDAIKFVINISANGGTNINGGLLIHWAKFEEPINPLILEEFDGNLSSGTGLFRKYQIRI